MYNLLALLIRFSGIIAFVVCESIALFWAVRYNKQQQEIYVSSANALSGFTYKRYQQVTNYFNLSAINDSLARENATLLSELEQSKFALSMQRDTVVSEDNKIKLYSYVAAGVINNAVNQRNNFLTLDKGEVQGVKTGMGVIGKDGVVGIVKRTSKNFSQVLSLLNSQSSISAAIRRTGFFGSLVWKGDNPRYATLEAIPKHASVQLGDTIQTSGYSSIFPKGIMIGIVTRFSVPQGSNFYNIEVLLNNDMSKLEYVYVVDNLFREELKALEQPPALNPIRPK